MVVERAADASIRVPSESALLRMGLIVSPTILMHFELRVPETRMRIQVRAGYGFPG
jgi:hypothetical protein